MNITTIISRLLSARIMNSDGQLRIINGVAQGAATSPILSSLYIAPLAARFASDSIEQRSRLSDQHTQRSFIYADDLMSLQRGDMTTAYECAMDMIDALVQIGLSEAPGKTSVRSVDDGFDFLGLYLRRYHGGCQVLVSERSKRKLALKVDNLMGQSHRSVRNFQAALDQLLSGWLAYFARAEDGHFVAESQRQRALATSRGRRR